MYKCVQFWFSVYEFRLTVFSFPSRLLDKTDVFYIYPGRVGPVNGIIERIR
jgi:hypothetical protein